LGFTIEALCLDREFYTRHSALIFERVIFFHRWPEQVNDIN
jgi:hypothetical protein